MGRLSQSHDVEAVGFVTGQAGSAHVALRGVSKRYGGTQALHDIHLEIATGSVHALVGENGAGKSTLGKVIAGVVSPDAGEFALEGRPVRYHSPHQALRDGVTIIAQEMALVPQLTVIENVLLGVESTKAGVLRSQQMRRRFADLSRQLDLEVDAGVQVGSLRIADQQKVEILRAIARDARLIVMDEPTAVLTPDESDRLFAAIRWLTGRGTTVVYISHFLDEVLRLSDVVTVMRNGRIVRTEAAARETTQRLVEAMLGRALELSFPPKSQPASSSAPLLSVRGLATAGFVRDISFDVRPGEIIGLAGLVGSGRSEVGQALFGARKLEAGEVWIDGHSVRLDSPRKAVRAGMAMVPESRKDQGLVMERGTVENVSLPHLGRLTRRGVFAASRERELVAPSVERMGVRGETGRVAGLSGGNQQKVLFAKWLFHDPRIFIADEPTRGVDVGAKRSIYEVICALAEGGRAVLVISSELEEVLGLAHRVLVMRQGRIAAQLEGDDLSEDNVMMAAFGIGANENGSPRA